MLLCIQIYHSPIWSQSDFHRSRFHPQPIQKKEKRCTCLQEVVKAKLLDQWQSSNNNKIQQTTGPRATLLEICWTIPFMHVDENLSMKKWLILIGWETFDKNQYHRSIMKPCPYTWWNLATGDIAWQWVIYQKILTALNLCASSSP